MAWTSKTWTLLWTRDSRVAMTAQDHGDSDDPFWTSGDAYLNQHRMVVLKMQECDNLVILFLRIAHAAAALPRQT